MKTPLLIVLISVLYCTVRLKPIYHYEFPVLSVPIRKIVYLYFNLCFHKILDIWATM